MPFRLVPRRDRKLNRLVKAATEVEIGRGESLYGPGDPADYLYLVKDGLVRIWLPSVNRPRRTVAVAGPFELFGFEALFATVARRRRYGASAAARTRLVSLPGTRAALALRTSEKTFSLVLRAVNEDLAAAHHLGGGRGGPSTSERLASVLVGLTDRFGVGEDQGTRLSIRVTHQDLADLAGAHRSTVTTLLNDWIYRRVLEDSPQGLLVRTELLLQQTAKTAPP